MLMIEAKDAAALSAFEKKFPKDAEIYRGVDVPGMLGLGPDDGALAKGPGAHTIDVKIARGRYGLKAGPHLFRVAIWTPKSFHDEFLQWYEEDHFPLLLECDEWHGGRLVEEKVADGCQFYAIHNLGSTTALDSDARKRSRSTPWFKKLAAHEWFDKGFKRGLYRRGDA